MKNIIVDSNYSSLNNDPSLSFFAFSASAKDVHTRALAVYFSAIAEKFCNISLPLNESGLFSSRCNTYMFGKMMSGEYLFYVVGKDENVEKVMNEVMAFIDGKLNNVDDIGKAFDRMSAKVPRIQSFPSPILAFYRFVWEKLLHIDVEDDVDLMYLNKITLIMKRYDASLLLTSLNKYQTGVVDRPVLVIGDIPQHYEVVDKLVKDILYKGKIYLHPLRCVDDVIYGYKAKFWYEHKGYGVVYERVRDYLVLYIYGKDRIPDLPSSNLLDSYDILVRELLVDPIYRIEVLSLAGHILVDNDLEEYSDTQWDDLISADLTIRGRGSNGRT